MNGIQFEKYADGLAPAIVQDSQTGRVLMLGFVNQAAIDETLETGKVTFYSRVRQTLWTKGETSGNFLDFVEMIVDCDCDTLLIKANPTGPVCHTGSATCFSEENAIASKAQTRLTLHDLETVIRNRQDNPSENSYTSKLFKNGINAIAQKVGEEAVELIIESKDDDSGAFKPEAADLIFHYLVLLRAKHVDLNDVLEVLAERRR